MARSHVPPKKIALLRNLIYVLVRPPVGMVPELLPFTIFEQSFGNLKSLPFDISSKFSFLLPESELWQDDIVLRIFWLMTDPLRRLLVDRTRIEECTFASTAGRPMLLLILRKRLLFIFILEWLAKWGWIHRL